jgi:divalent metal cation (Fe/Co/Zn/Cd) transporter
LGIDKIKTRQFGNKIYVDIEILADGSESFNENPCHSANAHDSIEEYYASNQALHDSCQSRKFKKPS